MNLLKRKKPLKKKKIGSREIHFATQKAISKRKFKPQAQSLLQGAMSPNKIIQVC